MRARAKFEQTDGEQGKGDKTTNTRKTSPASGVLPLLVALVSILTGALNVGVPREALNIVVRHDSQCRRPHRDWRCDVDSSHFGRCHTAVDQSHTSTSQEVVSAITYSQTGAGTPPPPAAREQEMHKRAPRTSTSSSPHMSPRLGVPRGDRYAVSHSQTHHVAYSHCQTDNATQKKRKLLPRATPGWWSQIRLNLEASGCSRCTEFEHISRLPNLSRSRCTKIDHLCEQPCDLVRPCVLQDVDVLGAVGVPVVTSF